MIPIMLLGVFAGAGGFRLPFLQTTRTVADQAAIVKGSGSSAASFVLNTDGTVDLTATSPSPTADDSQEWLPSGNTSDWHVRATLTSGTTPTTNAGLGTWLALSSSRTWGNTRTEPSEGVGITTSTLTFDFSNDGGSTTAVTYTGTTISAELII